MRPHVDLQPAAAGVTESADRGPLVVEFVGLPGAGKTTVTRAVRATLEARGWHCGDRRLATDAVDRLRHYGTFALYQVSHPHAVAAALRYAFGITPVTFARVRHALKLAGWPYRAAVARDRHCDLLLLDQGVVQNAWSVLLDGAVRNRRALGGALRRAVPQTGGRMLFVYLDVGVDVALARLAGRSTRLSRFDHMPATRAEELLRAQEADLRHILSAAVAASGGACHMIPADRPPAAVCATVARLIEQAAGAQPGGDR